jgi:hypothetical protein
MNLAMLLPRRHACGTFGIEFDEKSIERRRNSN